MTASFKVLPEDAGPWLRVESAVPVYWADNLDVRLGTARTRVEPDGLYADVVVTDDVFDAALKAGFEPIMSVHGQVLRESVIDDVHRVEELRIVSITSERSPK